MMVRQPERTGSNDLAILRLPRRQLDMIASMVAFRVPARQRNACVAGITAMATSLGHAACDKGVAGPTMNWAGVLCESRAETDDFFSPEVQACLKALVAKDKIQSAPAESCRLNEQYKAQLCKSWVGYGVEKSQRACMESTENIPAEVENGIGG